MALGGGIVALLAGGAWFLGRRRARDDGALAERAIGSPTGLRPALRPTQRLVPPLPATIAPRAAVEIGFRPIRAGTNLLSAAVDYELTIRNAGDAAASQVTLDVRLLSASADQDTLLASLFAAPIERARVAPFDLPPGEQRTMTGIAMLARDALTVMRAQGREFFVPVVAVNATYGWTGGAGQTANAQVIGIDRGPGAKMAPFGLSTPRMHDAVTARPHHLAVIQ